VRLWLGNTRHGGDSMGGSSMNHCGDSRADRHFEVLYNLVGDAEHASPVPLCSREIPIAVGPELEALELSLANPCEIPVFGDVGAGGQPSDRTACIGGKLPGEIFGDE